MNASKKRCPLPFLILLSTLWFVQSFFLPLSDGLPVRELALVEMPEQTCMQPFSGFAD